MKANDALYPIREICRIAGVNPITLRAWERRYGLIEPIRTESGHRLYTQEHIDQIKAAIKLTEQGIPISQVKQLLVNQNARNPLTTNIEELDLIAQIKQVLSEYDLAKLSNTLDLLFADADETTLNHNLRILVLETGNLSRDYLALLETQLLPRLYTRLRFATRHLSLSTCRKIWLQPDSSNTSDEILLLLVALYFAHQGIYPVLHLLPEIDNQALFHGLQKLRCEGIAIVANQKPLNVTLWDIWTDSHKSLEFYYFVNEDPITDLDRKLQCHYFNLNQVF